MGETYAVLGGGGFIGSNIVHTLVKDGARVKVLDDFSTGRLSNLESIKHDIEIQTGDIRDPDLVRNTLSGVDYVLLLAALPSVARSVEDPVSANDVNITGMLNVLMQARDVGVQRVVFSSSSSVYGDTPVLPKVETMKPQPKSPYAIHKLTGEHYARVFHELYGLETFCLRYFNVFGPRQNPKSDYAAVIPLFINQVLQGKAPTIEGDGLQTRDFTFVDDVVAANIACCKAPKTAAGGVYNVARGDRTSILELARTIITVCGKESLEPEHIAPRPGDVRDSQADATLANELLSWHPNVTLAQGLEKTLTWIKTYEM